MPAQTLVLVADDVEDNRIIFRTALEHRGFSVMVADNGHEAVDLVRQHQPDLIVMDVQMPKLTGIQAAAELKRGDGTCGIPILGISAFDVTEDELRQAGFCAFVAKPIAPLHLVRAVQLCLKRARTDGQWLRLSPSELAQDA